MRMKFNLSVYTETVRTQRLNNESAVLFKKEKNFKLRL